MRIRYKIREDLKKLVVDIINELGFDHIPVDRIYVVESHGSKSGAAARIYGVPRILQFAAGIKPFYVIEVISENFSRLSSLQQITVLIHELLHIPYNFSGSLRPHGKYVNNSKARVLARKYIAKIKSKRPHVWAK